MVEAPRTILVSACLLGLKTRYDGEGRANAAVLDLLRSDDWTPIPVCPEQCGGLPTPRPKAEFRSGDGSSLIDGHGQIVNTRGKDVSTLFLQGADLTVSIARLCRCKVALLKERSPSCGVHKIYRKGELTEGIGVTAFYLKKAGLQLFSEEDIVDGQLKTEEV
jgi:uncharacterized protein YbbK (DUF523 family)